MEGNVPEWAGPCGPFIPEICPQTFAIVSRKQEPVLRSAVFTPLVPKSRLSTGPNASALLRTCLILCYPPPPTTTTTYCPPPPPFHPVSLTYTQSGFSGPSSVKTSYTGLNTRQRLFFTPLPSSLTLSFS